MSENTLDQAAHLRNFLSPNSVKRLQEEQLARAAEEEQEELNVSGSSRIATRRRRLLSRAVCLSEE